MNILINYGKLKQRKEHRSHKPIDRSSIEVHDHKW